MGLSSAKQAFPSVIGLLGRAGPCSTEAQLICLGLHPSCLQLGPVCLFGSPSSTPNKYSPGTFVFSCLSLMCAMANGSGSKIPPHFCPTNLESAACASSWRGLVMSLVGALQALTGPSLPWLVQQRKGPWGSSYSKEHTNSSWVFLFPRANPSASRS